MQPFFFPTKVRQYQRCSRCGLLFRKKDLQCQHCIDIEEGKPLKDFIEENTKTQIGNKGLGAWLTLLAGGFVIIFLVGFISLFD